MGSIKSREWRKNRSQKYTAEGNPNYGNKGDKNTASQSVVRINMNGEMLERYPSVRAAADTWGANAVNAAIYDKTNRGYYFKKVFRLTYEDWVKHYIAKTIRILQNKPSEYGVITHDKITGPKPNPIVQLSPEGKYIGKYKRVSEVLQKFDIPQSTLYAYMKKGLVLKGYLWVMEKDYKKKSIISWFKK